MVTIHNKQDFIGMRKAGVLASQTLDYIQDYIKPGVSTLEINNLCHNYITQNGGICAPLGYRGFPKSICTSLNHIVCHGIPNAKAILKEGDILNIDVTTIVDGYHGDTSRMFTVGIISPLARKLINITKQALEVGIAAVKIGGDIRDIGIAIDDFITESKCGFSIVRDYCGHGIGKIFHDDPQVVHYDLRKEGINRGIQEILPGMFFTIEPMINAGNYETKLTSDGWTVFTKDRSLSAQFEHTIGVHENGSIEIFTSCI